MDISNCIMNTDIYDFLIDIIPKEEYNTIVNEKKFEFQDLQNQFNINNN